MTAFIIIAIIGIIVAVTIYSNRKAATEGEEMAKPPEEKEEKTEIQRNEKKSYFEEWMVSEAKRRAAMTKEERRDEDLRNRAYEIFSDQRKELHDYSNLTPEEASEEIERQKEFFGYLDDKDYIPLKRISEGLYPLKEFPQGLNLLNAAEVYQWWLILRDNDIWVSDSLFNRIANIIKPYHENTLLKELESVKAKEVESWMRRKKEEGYFFSYTVYDRCQKMWLSQFKEEDEKV